MPFLSFHTVSHEVRVPGSVCSESLETIMLRALALLVVLCGFPATLNAAGIPRIDSTVPAKFMAVGTDPSKGAGRGMTDIVLNGANLAASDTNGSTFDKDIEIFMRRDPGAWVRAEQPGHAAKAYFVGWHASRLRVEFAGADWLEQPGYLQFKVVVRGQSSNVIKVEVVPQPLGPPVITGLNQAAPFVTTATSEHDWGFRIVGRNFGLITRVRVDNQDTKTSLVDAPGGIVDATMPAALRNRPGRYAVQVSTDRGNSNLHWVDITAPPKIVTIDPDRIGGGKPSVQTAAQPARSLPTFMVTVHFTGSEPGEVRIRRAGGNWTAPVEVAVKAGAVELKLPSGLRQTPGKVEIRLRNGAGESVGTLEVVDAGQLSVQDRVRIQIPPIQKPGPGH